MIYLVCLLVGYDAFIEICFLPSKVVSGFQVYRAYTSVLFHGSILHVLFNMMALVPLGTELERIMGSIRLLYMIFLLATSNAIFHLVIALVAAHIPVYSYPSLMIECSIGFSGILFSMIVIETSLSGAQSRSVFGLFNVPAQWYAWILLILFQLLAPNVSLLGHLCGILSGFAYTYGLFNFLLPASSLYSSVESSSIMSACTRSPRFILCTGATTYGNLPIQSNTTMASSGLISGNIWRNLSSWMPQRGRTTDQPGQDPRFPGRGRTLNSANQQSAPRAEADLSLQTRLLDDPAPVPVRAAGLNDGPWISDARQFTLQTEGDAELAGHPQRQGLDSFEEDLKELIAMGFDKLQAEIALTAADGDPNVAIEILMTQQA